MTRTAHEPARDERRQAVLGLLATCGRVQWHDRGQDVAFADAVLELAARLGRVETVPALRPLRVATDAERRAAMSQIRAAFGRGAGGTGAPLSDEQGEQAHGDRTATQGSAEANSGGWG